MNERPSRLKRTAAIGLPIAAVAAACILVPTLSTSSPTVSGAEGDYTAIDPARLLDTRTLPSAATVDGDNLGAGLVPAGSVIEVGVAGRGNVASTATSAMLNVAAVNPDDAGFLTVFACDDDQPTA